MDHKEAGSDFDLYVAGAGARLLKLAYLLTGNLPDADDLVQEALARVFLAWPQVQAALDRDAYVRRVMVNANRRRFRRRRVAEVLDGQAYDRQVYERVIATGDLPSAVRRRAQRMRRTRTVRRTSAASLCVVTLAALAMGGVALNHSARPRRVLTGGNPGTPALTARPAKTPHLASPVPTYPPPAPSDCRLRLQRRPGVGWAGFGLPPGEPLKAKQAAALAALASSKVKAPTEAPDYYLTSPVEVISDGGGLIGPAARWRSQVIGRAAASVTRVVVSMPSGALVSAKVQNGIFIANQVTPTRPDFGAHRSITVRGYGATGLLVYQSPASTALPGSFNCYSTPDGQSVTPPITGQACKPAIPWG